MSKKLAQLRRSPRPTRSSVRDQAEEQATKPTETPKGAGISDAKSAAADASRETPNAEINENSTASTKSEDAIEASKIGSSADSAGSPFRHRRQVKNIIAKYAAWSSAASLLPIPIADVVGVSATQVSMVAELSRYYGVPFSKNFIRSILAAIAGGAVPWTATVGIVSLCKGMPGLGLGLGLAGMVGLTNLATRVLGDLFVYHFENGGDLSNVDKDKMRRSFQAELKNG